MFMLTYGKHDTIVSHLLLIHIETTRHLILLGPHVDTLYMILIE